MSTVQKIGKRREERNGSYAGPDRAGAGEPGADRGPPPRETVEAVARARRPATARPTCLPRSARRSPGTACGYPSGLTREEWPRPGPPACSAPRRAALPTAPVPDPAGSSPRPRRPLLTRVDGLSHHRAHRPGLARLPTHAVSPGPPVGGGFGNSRFRVLVRALISVCRPPESGPSGAACGRGPVYDNSHRPSIAKRGMGRNGMAAPPRRGPRASAATEGCAPRRPGRRRSGRWGPPGAAGDGRGVFPASPARFPPDYGFPSRPVPSRSFTRAGAARLAGVPGRTFRPVVHRASARLRRPFS